MWPNNERVWTEHKSETSSTSPTEGYHIVSRNLIVQIDDDLAKFRTKSSKAKCSIKLFHGRRLCILLLWWLKIQTIAISRGKCAPRDCSREALPTRLINIYNEFKSWFVHSLLSWFSLIFIRVSADGHRDSFTDKPQIIILECFDTINHLEIKIGNIGPLQRAPSVFLSCRIQRVYVYRPISQRLQCGTEQGYIKLAQWKQGSQTVDLCADYLHIIAKRNPKISEQNI